MKKKIISLPFDKADLDKEYYTTDQSPWSITCSLDGYIWLFNYRIILGTYDLTTKLAIQSLKDKVKSHIEDCKKVIEELDTIEDFKLTGKRTSSKMKKGV